MLVLTRKAQEQIQIGNNVTVTVLRIQGNTVRIGVQAPRDVRVVRGELKRLSDAELEQHCEPDAKMVSAVMRELELVLETVNG